MFPEEVGGEGDFHRSVELNTSVSIFPVGQPKETIEYICVYIRTSVQVCTYYVHAHVCTSVCTHNNVNCTYLHSQVNVLRCVGLCTYRIYACFSFCVLYKHTIWMRVVYMCAYIFYMTCTLVPYFSSRSINTHQHWRTGHWCMLGNSTGHQTGSIVRIN